MWPKYASARDFLHNAEEGKILHGKVTKKIPGEITCSLSPRGEYHFWKIRLLDNIGY